MQYIRLLITGLLVMGFFSALFGCRDRGEAAPSQPSASAAMPAPEATEYEQADIYRDLRDQILNLQPETLGLASDTAVPLAVVMETGHSEAVATLVCVADGSASLYFSNGGGIIGGGEHEAVNTASRSFIELSQTFDNSFAPVSEYPLPSEGTVSFYMVTATGVFAAQPAVEDDLGNMRESLSPLFHKGHEVIAAIRTNTPE